MCIVNQQQEGTWLGSSFSVPHRAQPTPIQNSLTMPVWQVQLLRKECIEEGVSREYILTSVPGSDSILATSATVESREEGFWATPCLHAANSCTFFQQIHGFVTGRKMCGVEAWQNSKVRVWHSVWVPGNVLLDTVDTVGIFQDKLEIQDNFKDKLISRVRHMH